MRGTWLPDDQGTTAPVGTASQGGWQGFGDWDSTAKESLQPAFGSRCRTPPAVRPLPLLPNGTTSGCATSVTLGATQHRQSSTAVAARAHRSRYGDSKR